MDMIIFLTLFSVLSVLYIAMGLYASRSIETNDDYFLAGRGLGLRDTSMTLIATQVGGGMLLGTAVESYSTGWYGLLYSFGMTAGLLILGFSLASKCRDFCVKYHQLFPHYLCSALRQGLLFLRVESWQGSV